MAEAQPQEGDSPVLATPTDEQLRTEEIRCPLASLEETVQRAETVQHMDAVQKTTDMRAESKKVGTKGFLPFMGRVFGTTRAKVEGSLSTCLERSCTVDRSTLSSTELPFMLPQPSPSAEPSDYATRHTLLIWADIGYADGVRVSLEAGADISERDALGDTALHVAAREGHIEVVKVLLSAGADVLSRGSRLRTPLHYAYSDGHDGVAVELMRAGADVTAVDEDGATPPMLAADAGCASLFDPLLAGDSLPDAAAVLRGLALSHTAVVGEIIFVGFDNHEVDAADIRILLTVAVGTAEEMLLLLESSASANFTSSADEESLLFGATSPEDVVRMMLEAGASVVADDREVRTPFARATATRSVVVMELMHNDDDNVCTSRGSQSPLEFAAAAEHTPSMDLQLPSNRVDNYAAQLDHVLLVVEGDTVVSAHADVPPAGPEPLRRAAEDGRVAHVRALLAAGVNPAARDWNRSTLLHLAAREGQRSCLRALLEAGAPVDARNDLGITALHYAAWRGHAHVVEELLRAGARVDLETSVGRTALHYAAAGNNTKVVEVLLQAGARRDIRDQDGKAPQDLAESENIRVALVL